MKQQMTHQVSTETDIDDNFGRMKLYFVVSAVMKALGVFSCALLGSLIASGNEGLWTALPFTLLFIGAGFFMESSGYSMKVAISMQLFAVLRTEPTNVHATQVLDRLHRYKK